jgi:hypothetical protein
MPAWGNTDIHNQKPKWDVERETRELIQLTVATGNTAGNNVITVTAFDGGPSTLANVGVAAGQYVYFWANGANNYGGQAGNGTPGMFFSNTQVTSVSGNTVVLGNPLFSTVSAGFTVEFDKKISYNANKTMSANYAADTVLVSTTRTSASNNLIGGNIVPGWVHIQKKMNNDGQVRYIRETLVALASPTASNTASGNTSWGTAFANT